MTSSQDIVSCSSCSFSLRLFFALVSTVDFCAIPFPPLLGFGMEWRGWPWDWIPAPSNGLLACLRLTRHLPLFRPQLAFRAYCAFPDGAVSVYPRPGTWFSIVVTFPSPRQNDVPLSHVFLPSHNFHLHTTRSSPKSLVFTRLPPFDTSFHAPSRPTQPMSWSRGLRQSRCGHASHAAVRPVTRRSCQSRDGHVRRASHTVLGLVT